MTDAQIIIELRQENAFLKQEIATLRRLIFGSKSEKHMPISADGEYIQSSLFDTEEAEQNPPQGIEKEQISYERTKKKHPGRNPIPEHLPEQEVIIEPEGLEDGMVKIGEEITETLEYTPASLIKKRIIRPKYADKSQDKIHIAPLPGRPLPKSIAEAGLLAHILVSKYIDHLPLYRQGQIFERDYQWKVAQSTMVDWVKGVCDLLKPLYESLEKHILQSNYIQADESPIKVLEREDAKKGKPPKNIIQGYQWVFYSPRLKGVLFKYRKGRGISGPKEILADFTGTLQSDGYQVYDHIAAQRPDIHLVGCLVHARRYFDRALDTDKQRSQYALGAIQKIYRWEREAKEATTEEHQQIREEKILPVLELLHEWAVSEDTKVLPQSAIGKALYYFKAQWNKIKRAAENAQYELDNNPIENKIRPLALGRKNFLFAGSHEGAKRMAMMYSFFGTCKQNNIQPYEWLTNTLKIISDYPVNKIHELLPFNHDI